MTKSHASSTAVCGTQPLPCNVTTTVVEHDGVLTDSRGALCSACRLFHHRCSGLRRKGALVADGELQRIMAHVDLDGNNTLDFQVGGWVGGVQRDRGCHP